MISTMSSNKTAKEINLF